MNLLYGHMIKKFDFKRIIREYIFVPNNCYESLNDFINNFIQINSGVSLSRFETITKTLFIRMEYNLSNEY